MSNLKLPNIHNYTDARRVLDDAGKSKVKVAHNTYLVNLANGIGVLYHDTYIVTYHEDGAVTLDCGGWPTSTTVNRMHNLTDFVVSGRYPRDGNAHYIQVRLTRDGFVVAMLDQWVPRATIYPAKV
ncbi:MAG: hypothetical protein M3Q39_15900 [Actinomycetota bacterium]|nr:hypothetical protein [Actinomycetota bacterium]